MNHIHQINIIYNSPTLEQLQLLPQLLYETHPIGITHLFSLCFSTPYSNATKVQYRLLSFLITQNISSPFFENVFFNALSLTYSKHQFQCDFSKLLIQKNEMKYLQFITQMFHGEFIALKVDKRDLPKNELLHNYFEDPFCDVLVDKCQYGKEIYALRWKDQFESEIFIEKEKEWKYEIGDLKQFGNDSQLRNDENSGKDQLGESLNERGIMWKYERNGIGFDLKEFQNINNDEWENSFSDCITDISMNDTMNMSENKEDQFMNEFGKNKIPVDQYKITIPLKIVLEECTYQEINSFMNENKITTQEMIDCFELFIQRKPKMQFSFVEQVNWNKVMNSIHLFLSIEDISWLFPFVKIDMNSSISIKTNGSTKELQLNQCSFEIFISLMKFLFYLPKNANTSNSYNEKKLQTIKIFILNSFKSDNKYELFISDIFFEYLKNFVDSPQHSEIVEKMIIEFSKQFPSIGYHYLLFIKENEQFSRKSILKKCFDHENILLFLIENDNEIFFEYINMKQRHHDINEIIKPLSKIIKTKNELLFKFESNKIFMIDLVTNSSYPSLELMLHKYETNSDEILTRLKQFSEEIKEFQENDEINDIVIDSVVMKIEKELKEIENLKEESSLFDEMKQFIQMKKEKQYTEVTNSPLNQQNVDLLVKYLQEEMKRMKEKDLLLQSITEEKENLLQMKTNTEKQQLNDEESKEIKDEKDIKEVKELKDYKETKEYKEMKMKENENELFLIQQVLKHEITIDTFCNEFVRLLQEEEHVILSSKPQKTVAIIQYLTNIFINPPQYYLSCLFELIYELLKRKIIKGLLYIHFIKLIILQLDDKTKITFHPSLMLLFKLKSFNVISGGIAKTLRNYYHINQVNVDFYSFITAQSNKPRISEMDMFKSLFPDIYVNESMKREINNSIEKLIIYLHDEKSLYPNDMNESQTNIYHLIFNNHHANYTMNGVFTSNPMNTINTNTFHLQWNSNYSYNSSYNSYQTKTQNEIAIFIVAIHSTIEQQKKLLKICSKQTQIDYCTTTIKHNHFNKISHIDHCIGIGKWLGTLTLSQNKPILMNKLDLKTFVLNKCKQNSIEGIGFFLMNVLKGMKGSIFTPKNPWISPLLEILKEMRKLQIPSLNLEMIMFLNYLGLSETLLDCDTKKSIFSNENNRSEKGNEQQISSSLINCFSSNEVFDRKIGNTTIKIEEIEIKPLIILPMNSTIVNDMINDSINSVLYSSYSKKPVSKLTKRILSYELHIPNLLKTTEMTDKQWNYIMKMMILSTTKEVIEMKRTMFEFYSKSIKNHILKDLKMINFYSLQTFNSLKSFIASEIPMIISKINAFNLIRSILANLRTIIYELTEKVFDKYILFYLPLSWTEYRNIHFDEYKSLVFAQLKEMKEIVFNFTMIEITQIIYNSIFKKEDEWKEQIKQTMETKEDNFMNSIRTVESFENQLKKYETIGKDYKDKEWTILLYDKLIIKMMIDLMNRMIKRNEFETDSIHMLLNYYMNSINNSNHHLIVKDIMKCVFVNGGYDKTKEHDEIIKKSFEIISWLIENEIEQKNNCQEIIVSLIKKYSLYENEMFKKYRMIINDYLKDIEIK